jgi:putative ABC transport system substrate-binding protein
MKINTVLQPDRRKTTRRELLVVLGGLLLTTPLAALAQQQGKVWRVGFLATTAPAGAVQTEAFREGLRERGYVEGGNIAIEYRWVDGTLDRLPELAAQLVRLKVDLIFAWGTPAVAAAKQATSTVPIVFAGVADPVESGLIANLARPGGNITGMSNLARGLSAKRVELLAQIVPNIKLVAALRSVENPASALLFKEVEAAARSLGLRLQRVDIHAPEDLEGAFASMGKERAAGVVILADPMFTGQRRRIAELATRYRMPSIYTNREYAEAGGLMSYGPNQTDMHRRAAGYVDKILKGAKPGDLPVEQPTKFELVINRKTAKALGLTIPQSLLISADKVIE